MKKNDELRIEEAHTIPMKIDKNRQNLYEKNSPYKNNGDAQIIQKPYKRGRRSCTHKITVTSD